MIRFIAFIWNELTEIRVPLVPWLRRTLWTPQDLDELSEDDKLVMQSGVLNNPVDIAEQMETYGASTAADLLRAMPPKQWVNLKRRLSYLRMVVLGGYMYDPLEWEIRQAEERRFK